jgi:hypothetical protein
LTHYIKKVKKLELDVELATIVNVPDAVKACIVCPPDVVIIPPVELGEIPSEPSVA